MSYPAGWDGFGAHHMPNQAPFCPQFRAALQRHEVGWAEVDMASMGVKRPNDLLYFRNLTGKDLTSTIQSVMRVTLVEALRIHVAAFGHPEDQAYQFGQLGRGGFGADAGLAGLSASSSSSINYVTPDTSLPMHVDISSVDLGEGAAYYRGINEDINEVALAEPDDYLMQLQRLSSDAKSEALQAVRNGQAGAPDGVITNCLADSVMYLEGHVQGNAALLAARSLRATSRATAVCTDGDLRAVLTNAEKRLYDHLVYETQLKIPNNNDRGFFIQLLEQALEVCSGSLEQKSVPKQNRDPMMERMFARLMNAYGKAICDKFPARGFFSNAKLLAIKRGPRGKRRPNTRSRGMATVPEDETTSETDAMPTGSDVPQVFRTYSDTTSDAGSSDFVRPPPGLEWASMDAGSESDSHSQISNSVHVEQRRNLYKAATALKPSGRPRGIVHASGARSECISLTDARSDTFECVAVPQDLEDRTVDSGMLVISELNRTLVWRDYHGHHCWYHNNDPDGAQEPLEMPNGHYLYTRPGADSLVASLLQNPKCSLVIAAGMGYWQCLPCARMLLEKAIPGSWVVDEVFEGSWYCNSEKYVITGVEVKFEGLPSEETIPGDDEPASCMSWNLKLNDDRSASCVRDGDKWHCELTPDGYLQWSSDDGIYETWTRASRSQPLSFVRRDKPADESHQDRVYIFDRECYIEKSMDPDGEVNYRKELSKIWSELQEFKLGSFDKTNTIFIDASNDDVSDPHNVLRVPEWNTPWENGDMGVLQDYISDVFTQQPQSIIDHIHKTPIVFDSGPQMTASLTLGPVPADVSELVAF